MKAQEGQTHCCTLLTVGLMHTHRGLSAGSGIHTLTQQTEQLHDSLLQLPDLLLGKGEKEMKGGEGGGGGGGIQRRSQSGRGTSRERMRWSTRSGWSGAQPLRRWCHLSRSRPLT